MLTGSITPQFSARIALLFIDFNVIQRLDHIVFNRFLYSNYFTTRPLEMLRTIVSTSETFTWA
jgi:hypothetical protein